MSFPPRMGILPPAQRQLWPNLKPASAREMYGPNFQPSESLKALVYFADGDLGALEGTAKTMLIESVSAVRTLPPVKILSRQLATE